MSGAQLSCLAGHEIPSWIDWLKATTAFSRIRSRTDWSAVAGHVLFPTMAPAVSAVAVNVARYGVNSGGQRRSAKKGKVREHSLALEFRHRHSRH